MIERILKQQIISRMAPNKVVILLGARRTGKTVLLQQIAETVSGRLQFLNGEDEDTLRILQSRTIANYRQLFLGTDVLIIDEAQHIPDIGRKLKLMADEIPGLSLLVSGSSSFDLLTSAGEPLVGRSQVFLLHPISHEEVASNETFLESNQKLEERIVYGLYPQVLNIPETAIKREYLTELVNAYLLKDILRLDGLRNASKMMDLLKLIAWQAGNEVSLEELGRNLGMSKNTVEKYLELLSNVFVIFKLGGFSRNLRKEVTKSAKWYFTDTGIRNAVINDFSPLAIRSDTGSLWEGHMIAERMKINTNHLLMNNYYFWRTYDRQEIDLIETKDSLIRAFEFKWSEKSSKVPAAFSGNYPEASYREISRSNFQDFVKWKMA